MPSSPDQQYKDAVTQAVREAKGIAAQTEFLANRCKNNAAILWHLFHNMFEARVRPDLEAAVVKVRAHKRGKASVTPLPTKPQPSAKPQRLGPESLRLGNEAIMFRSKLYQFKINGQPLANVPVNEVSGYLRSHERDGSFLRRVIAGIPDPMSDQPVSYFYKGTDGANEIDRMYDEAEAARKNAA
jgi:hypothetical protein